YHASERFLLVIKRLLERYLEAGSRDVRDSTFIRPSLHTTVRVEANELTLLATKGEEHLVVVVPAELIHRPLHARFCYLRPLSEFICFHTSLTEIKTSSSPANWFYRDPEFPD